METGNAQTSEIPKKLPMGTTIEGSITIEGVKCDVRMKIGIGSPDLTPEEHLCLVQGQNNGQTDIVVENEIGSVEVKKVILPGKVGIYDIASHGGAFAEIIEETSTEQPPTEQPRKGIKRILDWIGVKNRG
jgi:hypothetical protein